MPTARVEFAVRQAVRWAEGTHRDGRMWEIILQLLSDEDACPDQPATPRDYDDFYDWLNDNGYDIPARQDQGAT